MKSNGFFILVALLVLGYLSLLTIYSQSIDFSVQKEDFIFSHCMAFQKEQQRQQPFMHNNNVNDSASVTQVQANYARLQADDTHRQLKQASQPAATIPPYISQTFEIGHSIPTWEEMKQWDIDDNPQLRSQRLLYIITPTHQRITQMVDMTRLKQTLMLASLQQRATIFWIIIEDAEQCSQRIRTIAEDSGLPFAHKAITQTSKDKNGHRGLLQRNLGLETVLEVGKEGVIYFADDDNGYDVQLFTELLYTRYTSIFAVGLSGGSAYERCHVNEDTGKVDAILTSWEPRYRIPIKGKPGKFTRPKRKYGIDMAGFALSTTALLTKEARFTPKSTSGMLETDFLSQLVNDVSELEPLAANCTRILAWHVKTIEPQYFNNPEKDESTFQLLKSLV